MTSHELAALLLQHEDLPVSMLVFGHQYLSEYHDGSHGPMALAITQANFAGGKSQKYLTITTALDFRHMRGPNITPVKQLWSGK